MTQQIAVGEQLYFVDRVSKHVCVCSTRDGTVRTLDIKNSPYRRDEAKATKADLYRQPLGFYDILFANSTFLVCAASWRYLVCRADGAKQIVVLDFATGADSQ